MTTAPEIDPTLSLPSTVDTSRGQDRVRTPDYILDSFSLFPFPGCPLRLGLNEKRQKRDVSTNLPIISLDEVSEHSSRNDGWMVIYDQVYDVTNFLREHPGGEEVIERDLFHLKGHLVEYQI